MLLRTRSTHPILRPQEPWGRPQTWQTIYTLAMGLLTAISAGVLPAMADTKVVYQDIYLTEDRVCKKCHWEWVDREHVALTDMAGKRALVKPDEIIGIDTHPRLRRLFLKGLRGTGLGGKIIVPYPYDDAKDFICKYCD